MATAKRYIFIAKLLVILFAIAFIYRQIYQHEKEFLAKIIQAFYQTNNVLYILACLLLVFANWGLESYKWQKMIAKVERISFIHAFKAVLSGVTVSIFTPNRVGEFGGRVVYLDRSDWIKGALISSLCGFAQLLITIALGIGGFLFYFPIYFEINTYLYFLIAFISLAFLVLLVFMFLNISIFESAIEKFNLYLFKQVKIKWLKQVNNYLKVFSYYSLQELIYLLFISLLRYLVFSIQFWLMLKIFGIPLSLLTGLVLISVVFFCMTIIPTFAITEIGVRTSVAVFIIGSYYLHQNHPLIPIEAINEANPDFSPAVVASSFSLWLINLALPALIGAFFILRLRFNKWKK